MQAAILTVKLSVLEQDNEQRRQLAHAYDQALADTQLESPVTRPRATHVYHQYVVRTEYRDAMRAFMKERGVGTAIHYPQPVHQQPAYLNKFIGCDELPVTEQLAPHILSLPMYPHLTAQQVTAVCDALRAWAHQSAR